MSDVVRQGLPEGVPPVWSVVSYRIGENIYYTGVLEVEISRKDSKIHVLLTNGCYLCRENDKWVLKRDRHIIDLSAPRVKNLTVVSDSPVLSWPEDI